MTERITAEQEARNLLEQMGVRGAQDYFAGEVLLLANLIADKQRLEAQVAAREREVDVMQSQRNLAQAEVAALKAECANAGNYGLALEKAEATIAEMLSTLEEEKP